MKKLNMLLMSVMLINLAACDSLTPAQSAFVGALGGAIAFGALGASIGAKGSAGHSIATAAGAGLGAMAGHHIGYAIGVFNANNKQSSSNLTSNKPLSPGALNFSFSLSGQAKSSAVRKPKREVCSEQVPVAKFNGSCIEVK